MCTPPLNTIQLGANDTFYNISGLIPNITVNTQSGVITACYGNFQSYNHNTSQIELIFTIQVTGAPYNDQTPTTLSSWVSEGSGGTIGQGTATQNIPVTEPIFSVSKLLVGASNPRKTFSLPSLQNSFTSAGIVPGALPQLPNSPSTVGGVDALDNITVAVAANLTTTSTSYNLLFYQALNPLW